MLRVSKPKIVAYFAFILTFSSSCELWCSVAGEEASAEDENGRHSIGTTVVPDIPDYEDSKEDDDGYDSRDELRFHEREGSNAMVSQDGRTVHTFNEEDDEGFSGVITHRPLRNDEFFEIVHEDRLSETSKVVYKFDIGVTDFSPNEINGTFPKFMKEIEVGNWIPNWTLPLDMYALEFFGLSRTANGELKAYLNGKYLGVVATDLPDEVYGYVEIYSNDEVQISLIDQYVCPRDADPNLPYYYQNVNYLYCIGD